MHVNGVELFVSVRGAGEPLVLVHPSWGDHRDWERVAPALGESFTVVAYDRRGHSRSEGRGTVFDDADDLAGLIDGLELGAAHVVATSYGAIVALHAAIR